MVIMIDQDDCDDHNDYKDDVGEFINGEYSFGLNHVDNGYGMQLSTLFSPSSISALLF